MGREEFIQAMRNRPLLLTIGREFQEEKEESKDCDSASTIPGRCTEDTALTDVASPQVLEIHADNRKALEFTFQHTDASSYQPLPFSSRFHIKKLSPDVEQVHEKEQVNASQGPEQFDLTKADSDVDDAYFPT